MTRIALALALVLAAVSGAAMGAWKVVQRNDNVATYFDASTIRRTGGLVKMWRLADYNTIQTPEHSPPYLSFKVHDEYDCKERQKRVLFMSFHSGNMGGGDLTSTLEESQTWLSVTPGTVAGELWKFACGKK